MVYVVFHTHEYSRFLPPTCPRFRKRSQTLPSNVLDHNPIGDGKYKRVRCHAYVVTMAMAAVAAVILLPALV